MRPRIVAAPGPLDEARLAEVGALYGRADPKFLRRDVREHLLARGPAGPAYHALALDGDRLVGHCAAVPLPARVGARRAASAKVEALFVEEAHRGRRGAARPLAFDLLDELYGVAGDGGIELLHAFVRPEVGRVLRFDAVPSGEASLVAVLGGVSPGGRGTRVAAAGLRATQRATLGLAGTLGGGRGALRAPAPDDVDLVAASEPPESTWTVLAEDVWDWVCASPLVRVLEAPGSRTLLQLPGAPGDGLRVVGWHAPRPSAAEAVRAVAAWGRVARAHRASTLRFQPWEATSPLLARACRLLGFVRRSDFSTLHVRGRGDVPAEHVVPTPLLFLGF